MDHQARRRYVHISISSACLHEYVHLDTRHQGRGSCTHCSGTELGSVYTARGIEKLQTDPVAEVAPNEASKGDKNDSEKDKLDLKVRRFPLYTRYIIQADHPKFTDVEFSDEEREKAWKNITSAVEKYSDEMVEQWNKEIDGLLTFVRVARCTFAIPHTDRLCGCRLVFSLLSSLRSMCNHTSSCNQLLRIKRMRSSHRSPTSCPAFVPPPRL